MNFDVPHISQTDPEVAQAIHNELQRQQNKLEMIASENFVSPAVLEAAGSVFTNKYAEGYPGKRYYGGCDYADVVESLAIERAKKIFGADHANVQPHSGSQANGAVYLAALQPHDTILGMALSAGGHLTHGFKVNMSGRLYNGVSYGLNKDSEEIDYNEVEKLASEHKPKIIVAGFSAYSRVIDWQRFRDIADSVGALFMADIAHVAGLVAVGEYPSPVPYADFVTTTTHKTLRGPRSGLILCKAEHAAAVDKAVFPGLQGGPLVHIIAAKAVCFAEAMQPGFAQYQKQTKTNAQVLAEALVEGGLRIVSGGTDNHLMLVDLTPSGVTGKEGEEILERVGITCNKNQIPFDPRPPMVTSGIRLGTPALTSRGFDENAMREIGDIIVKAFAAKDNESELEKLSARVAALCERFPLYNGAPLSGLSDDREAPISHHHLEISPAPVVAAAS